MKMKSPEEFAAELLHSNQLMGEMLHVYDPAKAREYYLRTRKLKGRRSAAVEPTGGSNSKSVVPLTSVKNPAARSSRAKQRREEAQARVAALSARLDRLEKVLAELVKQAKARSGVETKETSTDKSSSKESSSKDTKPKTAAQKKADAQRAKEYREKNPEKKTSSEAQEIEAKIANVREKIAKMKAEIASAKKKAAAKNVTAVQTTSSPQTVPKGR